MYSLLYLYIHIYGFAEAALNAAFALHAAPVKFYK